MRYHKASEALPAELIEEIQKYIDGQYIYIPRRQQERRSWGENTRTRAEIRQRNRQMAQERAAGASIRALAQRYFLAEKTVAAILRRMREENE